MDLAGLHNENEFYSTYYLQELLQKDLKSSFAEWAQKASGNGRAPDEVLGGLSGMYFQKRNRYLDRSERAHRLGLQRSVAESLLQALGYTYAPMLKRLQDGRWLPVLSQVTRADGSPLLCVVEAPPADGDDEPDPLEATLTAEQFEGLRPEHAGPNVARGAFEVGKNRPLQTPLAELITQGLFALDEPPRWVLVLSATQIVLIDRNKWPQKRLLRFEIDEILSRKETDTLKAVVALLHRQSTCPEEGLSLLDTFDTNAHKHAFAVSEDLKYALREAIELIGNEVVWYLQQVRKEKTYEGGLDADQLTTECLRYMYRLLFLFYIEARPELGYAPMDSDEYLKGYSIESLRDLELKELRSQEARDGYYLHYSLEQLFSLVFNGFPQSENGGRNGQAALSFDPDEESKRYTFSIEPLRSRLFDPQQTPLLSKVKLRNKVLQRVIRLMSLSDPDHRARRERISYSALGINQLGAVYEALLSYSGFFAEENLVEVKKAGEKRDPLEVAYFVPEDRLDDFTEDEIVFDDDGAPLTYDKGTFIYRLAGREREKSASYYTPEVLTECLVRYALKELIDEDAGEMPADDILTLTICEPAMGSGAFLNEAVNQLAEAYLQRKQDETGDYISHEEYAREKQKVKMYIADTNVYGVDLNPVATELGEVSLWLNTIYEQRAEDPEHEAGGMAFVPWFGLQLRTGNSLIGARRQVYGPHLVQDDGGRGKPAWMETPPERVIPGDDRPEDHIYHFLLPDYEMANYSTSGGPGDLAEEEIKSLRSWRRDQRTGYDEADLETLQRLSRAIDGLWEKHARQQRQLRARTTDPIQIWGQPTPEKMRPPTTTRWKDRQLQQEIFSEGVRISSPYRRLKLVMDYWCALWFWPIDAHDSVPTRDEWLLDLQMILEGDLYETATTVGEQQALFPDTMSAEARQLALDLTDEHGFVNVDKLCERNPRLKRVRELAERYRFLHWELEFADLFEQRSGFDLVLGNPPWVKVEWDEGGLLSDYEPLYEIRKFRKSELTKLRNGAIEKYGLRSAYLADYVEAESSQAFLNAVQNYPLLKGMQTNSYKCFLPQGWRIGGENGVTAYLHPEGVYDDPKGGDFRKALYPRLRGHFQFINEMKLFSEVHNQTIFSLNVYRSKPQRTIQFTNIANLFTPQTVDACFSHDGSGRVPGIKDDDSNWNTEGHAGRIVQVDEEALALYAELYDEEGTPPRAARLPAVHSRQILEVLRKFAEQPQRLGDFRDEYMSLEMWHETNAQEDGTIRRETRFIDDPSEWVLSGPHFFVGTPFYKTPRDPCTSNKAYDEIDLTNIPANYLPRTNYVPDCPPDEYRRRTPTVPWGEQKPVTEFYRMIHNEMVGPSSQRTIQPSIVPKGVGHIHTCVTTCFEDSLGLLDYCSLTMSVPIDFRVKSTGASHANKSLINQLPILTEDSQHRLKIHFRTLLLNCLTTHYADLWEECWQDTFRADAWAKDDPRLNADTAFADLSAEWTWATPLRTRFARRQALVELDVLAAQALGLTLDELQTIYRVQFPVLRMYEDDTWYDRNGRIIFTNNRGLTGVGLSRPAWRKVKDKTSGTVEHTIEDDTQPGGPVERTIVYEAPFDRCDREADYAQAWGVFGGRGASGV